MTRTLHFPIDRQVGQITRKNTEPVPAIGEVEVPDDADVMLVVSGDDSQPMPSLDFLADLRPDDIHALILAMVTPEALAPISAATGLQMIMVILGEIGSTGAAHLNALPALRGLMLTSADLTHDGLAVLDLPSLASLTWAEEGLTDRIWPELARFTGLEELSVSSTGLTGVGLESLAALPALRSLSVSSAQLDDSILDRLAGCTALRTLSLSGGLDDNFPNRLAAGELPALESVNIDSQADDPRCTPQALNHLRLARENLVVNGLQMTPAMLARLARKQAQV
jgi:hypothetical protein